MKKIIGFIISIIFISFLTACNIKNNNKNNINKKEQIEISELDSETQAKVEDLYYEKYGKNIEWSNPYEVDGFDSIKELNDYFDSYKGYRFYGIYDDKYLFVQFGHAWGYIAYQLRYYDNENHTDILKDQITLIDFESYISRYSGKVLIYYNNEIIFDNPCYNISDVLNVSKEDALRIKKTHEAYIIKNFGQFMTEEEKDSYGGFSVATTRLHDEVYAKEHPNGENSPEVHTYPNPTTTTTYPILGTD